MKALISLLIFAMPMLSYAEDSRVTFKQAGRAVILTIQDEAARVTFETLPKGCVVGSMVTRAALGARCQMDISDLSRPVTLCDLVVSESGVSDSWGDSPDCNPEK